MKLKESARKILVGDVIKLLSAWAGGAAVFGLLFVCLDFGAAFSIGLGIFCGFIISSIPFGWRWVSSFFNARSPLGFIVKGLMSVSLGWVALPFIILKDILYLTDANKK